MKVTKWGEYGILICFALAKDAVEKSPSEQAPIGAAELSFRLSISSDYIHQVIRKLKQGNLIYGTKGPSGGFTLARPSGEITIKDIIEACEGETFHVICESETIKCENLVSQEACPVRVLWYDLKETINHFLEERTLLSLVRQWQQNGDKENNTPCREGCTECD